MVPDFHLSQFCHHVSRIVTDLIARGDFQVPWGVGHSEDVAAAPIRTTSISLKDNALILGSPEEVATSHG